MNFVVKVIGINTICVLKVFEMLVFLKVVGVNSSVKTESSCQLKCHLKWKVVVGYYVNLSMASFCIGV